jgi:presenilin-like A22 family membrane protease
MDPEIRSTAVMGLLLALSQIIALLIAPAYFSQGVTAFQNPSDPMNAVIYIVLILAFTAVILLLVKYRRQNFARYIVLGSVLVTVAFVVLLPILYAIYYAVSAFTTVDDALAANLANVSTLLAFVVAGVVTWILVKYPEWYVVDLVGLATAAAVTAILGLSFSWIPATLLLVALACYDAWAVYRSKHMVTLADELTSQRLPVLLVIPKSAGYKFSEQRSLKEQVAKGEEREAMFMGLGDLIIPGLMTVSALAWLPDRIGTGFLSLSPSYTVAIGTLIGSLVGFGILMRFVLRGNPQAGLPLLNGGALAGFFLTVFLVYHTIIPPA